MLALEERSADHHLEIADAMADRRRREVQCRRRFLEALQAHRGVERLQRQEQRRSQSAGGGRRPRRSQETLRRSGRSNGHRRTLPRLPGTVTPPLDEAGSSGSLIHSLAQKTMAENDQTMSTDETVRYEIDGPVTTVTIDRPAARNAVDPPTARALATAFRRFDADASQHVAILTGAGGAFCAGYDLKVTASGYRGHRIETGDGPMGPTRLKLGKPVIAAIEGHAAAGGLELALWCDLRVAARTATFGVYCRRFGVPLMDLGTVRLPRLIGQSRALDLILTGRGVSGDEAERIGLANRLVDSGR